MESNVTFTFNKDLISLYNKDIKNKFGKIKSTKLNKEIIILKDIHILI